MENYSTAEILKQYQSMPLEAKVSLAKSRIAEWVRHYGLCGVCVSFSGGKDSTVLLHIIREDYPEIPAVFSDTGLEYPEIRAFARSFDNVDVVRPAMRFDQVISTYGYPLISKEVAEAIYYARRIRSQILNVERESLNKRKELRGEREWSLWASGRLEAPGTGGGQIRRRAEITGTLTMDENFNRQRRAGVAQSGRAGEGGVFSNGTEQFGEKSMFNKEKWLPLARDVPVPISHVCCQVMKKSPMAKYQRKNRYHPFIGTLAEESRLRKQAWIRHGCNAFDTKKPTSQPLSVWREQDVLNYIVNRGLSIAPVYGDIVATDPDGIEYPAAGLLSAEGMPLRCTGCQRTGCVYCAFGLHLEKGETRFQALARTHPRLYEYSIGGGAMG